MKVAVFARSGDIDAPIALQHVLGLAPHEAKGLLQSGSVLLEGRIADPVTRWRLRETLSVLQRFRIEPVVYGFPDNVSFAQTNHAQKLSEDVLSQLIAEDDELPRELELALAALPLDLELEPLLIHADAPLINELSSHAHCSVARECLRGVGIECPLDAARARRGEAKRDAWRYIEIRADASDVTSGKRRCFLDGVLLANGDEIELQAIEHCTDDAGAFTRWLPRGQVVRFEQSAPNRRFYIDLQVGVEGHRFSAPLDGTMRFRWPRTAQDPNG